jgi:hypothetical protein
MRSISQAVSASARSFGMMSSALMPPVHEDQYSRLKMKKGLAEAKPLIFLVARGGIEPPTQGFSILCSTD